jgi:WD40 repeat protein
MPGSLVDDLRRDIADGRVVCVVGAGVSMAATFDPRRKPNIASWVGLLESGVDECVKVAQPLPAGWEERVRGEIVSGDIHDLLSAAEKISAKLSAPSGGAWGKWLRETVGSLRILHPEVPAALRDLGLPLLTTNYDSLLEEATGANTLTWKDSGMVGRALRGDERAIVHLHGHWMRPDTVILGIRSYEEVLRDAPAQALQQGLRAMSTLLFVGFGGGLDDPNFGALLRWSRATLADSHYQQYRLCRESEVAAVRAQHPAADRIMVVSYGKEFSDLAPFLRLLRPRGPGPSDPDNGAGPQTPRIPLPPTRIAGRPAYQSAEIEVTCQKIEAAYARRKALIERGFNVSELNREIAALRRLLREGGRFREGDSLGDGRYLLLNQVGRGGFATVWRAHDRDSDEIVAIKILHGNLAGDPVRRDRFLRGARAMAALDHDAIVRLREPHGEDGGHDFFVMEFMDGGDMTRLVRERRPSVADIIEITCRVGGALAHAHSHGLVHRDVKPANILFDSAGRAKLTDFDLVTAGDDSTGGTATGPLGTFFYAAPEMRTHPHEADPRADVYSLGKTAAFGFFGGSLPIVPESVSIIDKLACSKAVKTILKRAIAWEADQRFPTVEDFCDALKSAFDPEPITLPPGPSMVGQDLSRKDLRGADLVRADLRGAILVGAILKGAQLRDAKLIGADLSHAFLEGADLRHADLSSARLIEADLRGARLEGARFREAKLLGALVDAGALDDCDTFGAALPKPENIAPTVGLSSPCGAVAWSPDGAYLASGHKDGSVRIWSVSAMEARRILVGHKGAIKSVAFNQEGTLLASGSADGTIRLWDVANGKERRFYQGHSGAVASVAFSHDGMLASGSADGTVRIWGAGPRVLSSPGSAAFESVAFSPDGLQLAGASQDGTIRLWNTISGAELAVLGGSDASARSVVRSVVWSPDGAALASGSDDKTVRLWNVATGAVRWSVEAHRAPVWSIAFSPDGATLATASSDRTARLWDALGGALRLVLDGFGGPVGALAWSPDGKALATGSDDTTIRLWNTTTAAEKHFPVTRDCSLVSVAFSHDGETLATGSKDEAVRLWNVRSVSERRPLVGASGQVIVFSPDKITVAGGSRDGTVRLWDVGTGEERRALRGHGGPILGLAFSADGATLASGSKDTTARLWDTATGEVRSVFEARGGTLWSIAFDLRGGMIAVGSRDTTIRLWSMKTATERHVLEVHEGPVLGLAFSPDGTLLASGARDTTVSVWDARSGTERHRLEGHEGPVATLAWSPDGSMLASGSEDKTVRLWDVATGAPRRVRVEHTASVTSLAFSPDGTILASAALDGTVRLWDPVKGHCLAVLLPLPEGWVFFMPDGRFRLNGNTASAFWHTVGLCRLVPEELECLPTPLLIQYKVPWLT